MNIVEALVDEAPARSTRKCKVQRWLDSIEPGTPGLDDLNAMVMTTSPRDPHYRPADQALRILFRLGLETSIKTFGDHRAKRCRCFD